MNQARVWVQVRASYELSAKDHYLSFGDDDDDSCLHVDSSFLKKYTQDFLSTYVWARHYRHDLQPLLWETMLVARWSAVEVRVCS